MPLQESASRPDGVVPNVMMVLIPALFCLTIFSASMTRWRTVALPHSVFSMSMSIALSEYALMTFWYAPASALALEQNSPSLLPDQPPTDTVTSPPFARIRLIWVWSLPPVSGRLPSQAGLQVPSDRMNASVNHLMPVAFITDTGSG